VSNFSDVIVVYQREYLYIIECNRGDTIFFYILVGRGGFCRYGYFSGRGLHRGVRIRRDNGGGRKE